MKLHSLFLIALASSSLLCHANSLSTSKPAECTACEGIECAALEDTINHIKEYVYTSLEHVLSLSKGEGLDDALAQTWGSLVEKTATLRATFACGQSEFESLEAALDHLRTVTSEWFADLSQHQAYTDHSAGLVEQFDLQSLHESILNLFASSSGSDDSIQEETK